MIGSLKSRNESFYWSIVKVFGLLSNSVVTLVLQTALYTSKTRSLIA
jgi:hypothetical protein